MDRLTHTLGLSLGLSLRRVHSRAVAGVHADVLADVHAGAVAGVRGGVLAGVYAEPHRQSIYK